MHESQSNSQKSRSRLATTIGVLLVFALTFAALQLAWQATRGSTIERAVIHHATVRPAVFLINSITPQIAARAVDSSVRARGGGINILNGCEGVDALFLLAAAFLVAPLPVRTRLLGFAAGIPLVFFVNQTRILGLFYAYRHDDSLFYAMHATVAPVLVVIVVAAYFYYWLARGRRSAS